MALLIEEKKNLKNEKNGMNWTDEWFIIVFFIHFLVRRRETKALLHIAMQRAAPSECISTHHRNSSNSREKYFSIFFLSRNFIAQFSNGKWKTQNEQKKSDISSYQLQWYFLCLSFSLSLSRLSRWKKVRKYIAGSSAGKSKGKRRRKITIFYYLIDFTLGGLRGAGLTKRKGKAEKFFLRPKFASDLRRDYSEVRWRVVL